MNTQNDQTMVSNVKNFSVEELGLVDAETPEAFDAITRLALRLFDVPVALMSIVQQEQDRQFFTSQQGLSEPWASKRQTPLSHSFCQYVTRDGKPLIVNDARKHPLVCDNLAVAELDVIAYLGVPISGPCGTPVGALCVIESTERIWTEDDLSVLLDLARCLNDEIVLRASLIENQRMRDRTTRYSAMRESIALAFMAPDQPLESRFQQLLAASCAALGFETGIITKVDGDQAILQFTHGLDDSLMTASQKIEASSLTQLVISQSAQVQYSDIRNSTANNRSDLVDRELGSYMGAPLVFDGTLYGTLEFSSKSPRAEPWNEEDMSILSIVAMFATAHLGLFGKIQALQQSENAMLRDLIEIKRSTAA